MLVGMFSRLQKCYAVTCLVLFQVLQNLPNTLQLPIYLVLMCYSSYLIKFIFKDLSHCSLFCNHMIKRFPAELLTVITRSYITPCNEQKSFFGGGQRMQAISTPQLQQPNTSAEGYIKSSMQITDEKNRRNYVPLKIPFRNHFKRPLFKLWF